MIELFSANTPNGWKISIMLEEIGYKYKVTPVDLGKDCLLYTSPSPRDKRQSRMPSSA